MLGTSVQVISCGEFDFKPRNGSWTWPSFDGISLVKDHKILSLIVRHAIYIYIYIYINKVIR